MRTVNRTAIAALLAASVAMPFALAQSGSAADPKVNTQPNANQSAAAAGTMDPAPSEAAMGGKPAAEIDVNFDGSVSRDEAATQGMSDADFDAGDVDGNGLMSKSEYENALTNAKQ